MIDPRQLRKALVLLDWTPTELSELTGIEAGRIEKFTKGTGNPDADEAARLVDVIGSADRKRYRNPTMAEDLMRPWLTGNDSVDRAHYAILEKLERLRAVNHRLGEIYPVADGDDETELYDIMDEKMRLAEDIERLQAEGSSGRWAPHLRQIIG